MIKKAILLTLLLLVTGTLKVQVNTLEEALKSANKENKLILMNVSGSYWCAPCIAIHNAIFIKPEFISFDQAKLIFLTLDFPIKKVNQLSKQQQEYNDVLAEKYNPQRNLPHMLLINIQKSILKKWDGYDPSKTVKDFIKEISLFIK